MIIAMSLFLASVVAVRSDTTVLLGRVERDITGDSQPEILQVVGAGRTIDSLDVTFTMESAGQVIYRFKLAPITRTIGFDAGRRVMSAEQHRARLRSFSAWFFAERKFQRPAAFLEEMRMHLRRHVDEIPNVIARDRKPSDTGDASGIWQEMLKAPISIFSFSPGGDAVEAIGWSPSAHRFFRLLDCC